MVGFCHGGNMLGNHQHRHHHHHHQRHHQVGTATARAQQDSNFRLEEKLRDTNQWRAELQGEVEDHDLDHHDYQDDHHDHQDNANDYQDKDNG